jgi:hypothetical protein
VLRRGGLLGEARHDAAAVLLVFVDADAVRAHFVGELDLIHVLVGTAGWPVRDSTVNCRCRPRPNGGFL